MIEKNCIVKKGNLVGKVLNFVESEKVRVKWTGSMYQGKVIKMEELPKNLFRRTVESIFDLEIVRFKGQKFYAFEMINRKEIDYGEKGSCR